MIASFPELTTNQITGGLYPMPVCPHSFHRTPCSLCCELAPPSHLSSAPSCLFPQWSVNTQVLAPFGLLFPTNSWSPQVLLHHCFVSCSFLLCAVTPRRRLESTAEASFSAQSLIWRSLIGLKSLFLLKCQYHQNNDDCINMYSVLQSYLLKITLKLKNVT